MTAQEKLTQDLKIFRRFIEEITDYLSVTKLFYNLGPTMPKLTIGGLLMRQARLLQCRDLLDQPAKNELDKAVADLQAGLSGRVVAFEKKAHEELEARLRQWKAYLGDIKQDDSAADFHANSVECRVMIQAIIDQLSLPPYQLNSPVPSRVVALDDIFRSRWIDGDFVWPDGLEAAYPKDVYWYLYGLVAKTAG